MTNMPDRDQQIRQVHAELIINVVNACQRPEERPALDQALAVAVEQGWGELVQRIRLILDGRRDAALLNGLDEEDTVIIRAILLGLQDPATLPDPSQQANPAMAAPGLAHMIHAANHGDAQALQAVAMMAEQMTRAEGDMRLLGGNMQRLLKGERDADLLCKGMGVSGSQLMLSLLEELNKLGKQ